VNFKDVRPKSKISLTREEPFFGPGTAELLTLIRQTGSVRTACDTMGLSYSKAWRMIRGMENATGCTIVLRFKGGKDGGHAEVSPEGEDLLARYTAFEAECQTQIQKLFYDHFGEDV